MKPTALLALVVFALACGPGGGDSASPAADNPNEIGVIRVAGLGEIRIRFMPDKAPKHVAAWKKLAREKFYDGTTFHRVIPGFMIQGGDPNTKDDDATNDGFGGPAEKLPAEFNDVSHKRGIVSMARGADPNSAGSQFFIVVKDSTFLDKKYTVFGEVISGMEVADKIVEQPRDQRDRPLANVVMESVTVEAGP